MEDEEFKVEIREIDISDIVPNNGQVEGVPKNPRKISKKRFEELKDSIRENPEMRKLNEVKVFPWNGKYVDFDGNQRLKAYKELGYVKILCKVIPEDWPKDKIRRYIMQANNSYGEYDLNVMRDCWDADEIVKCNLGIDVYESEEKDKIKGEEEFTEVLNEEHNYLVLYFDNRVDWLQAQTLFGVKTVKCLPTKSDGTIPKGREKYAVGRVLRGPDAINNLLSQSGRKNKEKKDEKDNI